MHGTAFFCPDTVTALPEKEKREEESYSGKTDRDPGSKLHAPYP